MQKELVSSGLSSFRALAGHLPDTRFRIGQSPDDECHFPVPLRQQSVDKSCVYGSAAAASFIYLLLKFFLCYYFYNAFTSAVSSSKKIFLGSDNAHAISGIA